CMLKGGYGILQHIEGRLGFKAGETTPDGAFSIVEEECLAACANAPMMICGDDYFLDLTPEKVDVVLDELRKRFREGQKTEKPAPLNRTMFGMGPGGEKV
ncbi:MAG TPA: NAD(P)H-dependent oxidoreductase subunit E, partial [Elusimicrobiota bacterium]|nr:NAD(P)H-dependent oxidoreductase subunit E [Elusimicrobiota bacterium]